MTVMEVKQKLLSDIEQLPEYRLPEVLSFVDFLLSQAQRYTPIETQSRLPENNPLFEFIGGVTHGALAKDIDKELYGA
jgi:hypothetical protein